jgi:hypothetical protein
MASRIRNGIAGENTVKVAKRKPVTQPGGGLFFSAAGAELAAALPRG